MSQCHYLEAGGPDKIQLHITVQSEENKWLWYAHIKMGCALYSRPKKFYARRSRKIVGEWL